jgi:hypothetical protein
MPIFAALLTSLELSAPMPSIKSQQEMAWIDVPPAGTERLFLPVSRWSRRQVQQLAASGDVQFSIDALQMDLHRVVGNSKGEADLLVGGAILDEPQNLEFPSGEKPGAGCPC